MNQYSAYIWSSYLFVAVGWAYLVFTSIQKSKMIQRRIRQQITQGKNVLAA